MGELLAQSPVQREPQRMRGEQLPMLPVRRLLALPNHKLVPMQQNPALVLNNLKIPQVQQTLMLSLLHPVQLQSPSKEAMMEV
jgi:hypothetical protein